MYRGNVASVGVGVTSMGKAVNDGDIASTFNKIASPLNDIPAVTLGEVQV